MLTATALVVLLHVLSQLFLPPAGDMSAYDKKGNIAEANGIMREPDNSIDVVFVGDSEAYAAFSPLQMWSEYGFTSYVCATSGQLVPYGMTLLHRAARSQQPRVVVIETDMVYRSYSIDYLLGRVFQDLFPVFEFHNRWKNLMGLSLAENATTEAVQATKGFRTRTTSKAVSSTGYVSKESQVKEVPLRCKWCLQLMVAFCRRIGATPVLVSTPSTVNWNTARHDGIAALAEALDVTYIDLNAEPTKLAMDWSTDTYDAGDHLNLSGATKVSRFVGDYLRKNYDLVDRRHDASYQAWNDLAARYGQMD